MGLGPKYLGPKNGPRYSRLNLGPKIGPRYSRLNQVGDNFDVRIELWKILQVQLPLYPLN